MSSRILRRYQENDEKEKINIETSDFDESLVDSSEGTVKHNNLPVNLFEVLNVPSECESDVKTDENEESTQSNDVRRKKKKKKKKKVNKINHQIVHEKSDYEDECEDFLKNDDATELQTESTMTDITNIVSYIEDEASPVALKLKNLNPNNELKKIFGASVINRKLRSRKGRRPQMKHLWLINPKDHWPSLVHSGISMKVERKNGTCMFYFEHDQDYQKTQKNFLNAIQTMNADKIAYIVKNHPYHVDALIQLSDIYRASEDLQMAADLNERALYCLEFSFHPCFKMDRSCRLDYRRQQNRALFVSLFKHLTFVGERACYRTALELCKLILNFDFELDPLAVVLCMDFYALRSRQYAWLISAASEWESKKNLSQLPNFAFSTALAHFYESSELDNADLTVADKLLQDALILFPGALMLLLEKCSVQCDPVVSQHPFFTLHVELDHSPALMRLITLYVHRTYHEWKVPRVVSWLERNVHEVLDRLNAGDPWITECMKTRRTKYTSLPRNVLRHLILSDIKEVMTGIGQDGRVGIFTFDPVPPLDSIDIYSNLETERNLSQSQSLTSLFFRSLLPNFDAYNRRGAEGGGGPAAENAVAEIGLVLEEAPGSLVADALRYGVSMLMAAVESVVTDLANRVEARIDGVGQQESSEETESDTETGESDEAEPTTHNA